MQESNAYREFFWLLRRPAQLLLDLGVLSVAFFMAFLPAINIVFSEFNYRSALNQIAFVVLTQFSALYLFGAYTIIWRYVSLADVKVFLKAALLSGAILLTLRFILAFSEFRIWQVPISVILIDTVLGFGGLLAVRVVRRTIYEFAEKNKGINVRRVAREPVLLIGAGRIGASIAKEMVGRADAQLEIRGFVDDDSRKIGGSLNGIKVLGTTKDIGRLAAEMSIKQVVIAIDSPQGREIRRILDLCTSISLKAQIVPSLNEIAHGRVSISRVRDVEIEDLLGRDPIELDNENLHDFLSDKTVLVSGAGGSIGSELVRQIADYSPRSMLLVERSEFQLFEINREATTRFGGTTCIPLMADVGEEMRMREIFARYKPDVVFHAAAHKHVPLMEANTIEAVKNNVFATRLLGELSGEFQVSDFVLISTDKAVNPTSIMGASKRVAEIVVQTLNEKYSTNYVAVRFGNVLGSAGSVVPIFREQIRNGEPVTVTHKDMLRYFMTIPEASQLVLQAGALGARGEIFVLDMGKPVRILDLAEDMIRLSGLVPYEDVDIRFTGMRKGEKLFEELEIKGEDLVRTKHPKIFIGRIAAYSPEEVGQMLNEFQRAVEHGDEERVRWIFADCLPESSLDVEKRVLAVNGRKEDAKYFARPSKLGLAEK